MMAGPLENRGDRPHYVSIQVSLRKGSYTVDTTGDQGSARISALIAGNGLIRLEPGAALAKGDVATVMLLSKEFEPGAA